MLFEISDTTYGIGIGVGCSCLAIVSIAFLICLFRWCQIHIGICSGECLKERLYYCSNGDLYRNSCVRRRDTRSAYRLDFRPKQFVYNQDNIHNRGHNELVALEPLNRSAQETQGQQLALLTSDPLPILVHNDRDTDSNAGFEQPSQISLPSSPKSNTLRYIPTDATNLPKKNFRYLSLQRESQRLRNSPSPGVMDIDLSRQPPDANQLRHFNTLGGIGDSPFGSRQTSLSLDSLRVKRGQRRVLRNSPLSWNSPVAENSNKMVPAIANPNIAYSNQLYQDNFQRGSQEDMRELKSKLMNRNSAPISHSASISDKTVMIPRPSSSIQDTRLSCTGSDQTIGQNSVLNASSSPNDYIDNPFFSNSLIGRPRTRTISRSQTGGSSRGATIETVEEKDETNACNSPETPRIMVTDCPENEYHYIVDTPGVESSDPFTTAGISIAPKMDDNKQKMVETLNKKTIGKEVENASLERRRDSPVYQNLMDFKLTDKPKKLKTQVTSL
ncbi:MAG: hypothetical protein MHMPM18_000334 [Marteilia pararefringens]